MPSCWLGIPRVCGLCRRFLPGTPVAEDLHPEVSGSPCDEGPEGRPTTLLAASGAVGCEPASKANVDYSRFQALVDAEDAKERAALVSVAVCGRRGWNGEAINGVYVQDGWLNGRQRLRKSDGARWLKFNDAKQWMISRFPDGRPLGEAFASDDPEDPRSIRGIWRVCTQALSWEEDDQISVTSGECQGCGQPLIRALRCGQCRAVSYCSGSCQKADWRYHKRRCQPPPRAAGRDDEGEGRCAPKPSEEQQSSALEVHQLPRPAAPNSQSLRGSVAHGCWEEVDLMGWARQRLEILLGGPKELEGLPALRVPYQEVGHVEVTGVKEIEGLASVWPNPGGARRHLFDLSFQVVFNATWLGDFGLVSMDGLVLCDDFTSNLVSDPEAACGMFVDFAHSVDSFLEMPRMSMQKNLSLKQCGIIKDAVGANAWSVNQGIGLMHLVHLRLRRFAAELEAK